MPPGPDPEQTSAESSMEKSRPRAGRPPKIDSDHLLKVAREVFLERGFRATTQEVAERAGVSEGILFHRFKNKEVLFRRAMRLEEGDVPDLLMEALDSVSGLDLTEALRRLAVALLEIGRVGMPLMMMSWSNPICGGPDDKNLVRFRTFVKHLGNFFEQEMEAGRLRRMNAEILARTFLGSIHYYCMSRIMSPDSSWIVPEETFVPGLVDLLLHGAEPSAETNAGRQTPISQSPLGS